MPLDPIHQWISSTMRSLSQSQRQAESASHSLQPNLILLQHSLLQRHMMGRETKATDKLVYERAKVRTPAQNAQRDFLGGTLWLLHLASEFQQCATGAVSKKKENDSCLVWVQTTAAIPIHEYMMLVDSRNAKRGAVTILNAASDPFAWDKNDLLDEKHELPEETASTRALTMENLNTLASAIENHALQDDEDVDDDDHLHQQTNRRRQRRRPIVIESLTPILVRHGFARTCAFLTRLQNLGTPLVVPILVEMLSAPQHRTLEDMAQAVLYLNGGDMTMIRQGVRERGNVVRENIPFQLVTSKHVNGTRMSIQIVVPDATSETETTTIANPVAASTTSTAVNIANGNAVASVDNERAQRGGGGGRRLLSGKIKLELQEDDHALSIPLITKQQNASAPPRPHIFVQDNDPEFDDMDEEDPDDDLDI